MAHDLLTGNVFSIFVILHDNSPWSRRASASLLVCREFDSAGSYQDLVNWYCSLLPGARCAEELQGTHPEHTKK